MKKLFVTGGVCIFVVIAWLFYLSYDMVQFKRDPLFGSGVSQPADTTSEHIDRSVVESVSVHSSDTQAPVGEEREVLESEKSESQRVNDDDNIDFQEIPMATVPEASVPGLTPELEKIFVDYKPLHEKLLEVGDRHVLMDRERYRAEVRVKQIREGLPGTRDKQKRQNLYKEEEELTDWLFKSADAYIESQNEYERLLTEQTEFFAERGFSDREFWKIHTDTFISWLDN